MEQERKRMHLQGSEAVVAHAASRIFSAYIAAGKVDDQNQEAMMGKAVELAVELARVTDKQVLDDSEIKRRGASTAF